MKVQPNFSWQKYEGKPEDANDQFQRQLQSQHIAAANAINTTIDDLSYYNKERVTGFTWIDGKLIWTNTYTGVVVGIAGPAATPIDLNINGTINKIIHFEGEAQDAMPFTAFAIPLPYVDPITPANGIGLFATPTQLFLATNAVTWNGYLFSVTIYYTKV